MLTSLVMGGCARERLLRRLVVDAVVRIEFCAGADGWAGVSWDDDDGHDGQWSRIWSMEDGGVLKLQSETLYRELFSEVFGDLSGVRAARMVWTERYLSYEYERAYG